MATRTAWPQDAAPEQVEVVPRRRRREARRAASPSTRRPVQRQTAVRLPAAVARRRHFALLVLVGLATLAAVVLLGQLGQAVQAAGVPDRTVTVQVGAGESLWQIARRSAPDADPGAVVERIVAENGLTSADVSPGQVVRVPTG